MLAAGRRRRPEPRSPAASPTSCCSPAAPTAATPSRSWPVRRALAASRGRARSSSPATSRPSDEVARDPGRRPARASRRQHRAADRRPRPGRRPRRDPRAVPLPRDRRQAPQQPRADFLAMVRGATPDVVLTGVELLADGAPGDDVVVVDVGGATTDVHSVVELDPEDAGLSREVVATTPVTRTVEGDLGMRWSAVTTVEAAGRDDLAARPPRAGATTRRSCPATTPRSATSTRRSPARPSASPCAGTPAAARSWSAPRAGSSSAPARTCARSTCWSAPAACCATAGPASPARVLARQRRRRRRGRLAAAAARRRHRRPRLRARRRRAARRASTPRRRTRCWCRLRGTTPA